MTETDVRADAVTYNTLICGFCSIGEFCSVWAVGGREEILLSTDGPRDLTERSNVQCFTRFLLERRLYEAVQLFNDMQHKGIQPNQVTYNILIDGLCRNGEVGTAINLFNEIKSSGQSLDLITYGALLNGLLKNQVVDRAIEIFHSMEDNGFEANICIYKILIDGLCKAGKLVYAGQIFCELCDKRLVPDIITYTTMINGLCK
ncbi:hypothetical protein C5167_033331, partial [Papaver somniferum]